MKRYTFDAGSISGNDGGSVRAGGGAVGADILSDGASTLSQTVDDFHFLPPNLDNFPSDPVMIRDFVDGAKDLKVPQAWVAAVNDKGSSKSGVADAKPKGSGVLSLKDFMEVRGAPKARVSIFRSAMRLYTAAHADVDAERVRDVIEEVMQWGQVLASAEINSETEVLQRLAKHDAEMQALNDVVDDKTKALQQLGQTMRTLNQYVRELEGKLEAAGISLAADGGGSSPTAGPVRAGNFNGNSPKTTTLTVHSWSPRWSASSSGAIKTPPRSAQTEAFDTPTSTLSLQNEVKRDFLSSYQPDLPDDTREVYQKLVEAAEKTARAHAAVEAAKYFVKDRRAKMDTAEREKSTKGSTRYLQQAKDGVAKAEAEANQAAKDVLLSRRLFVMLAARLANVSHRREEADLVRIDNEVAEAMAKRKLPRSGVKKSSITSSTPPESRSGGSRAPILAPGGVDISKLQLLASTQDQTTATDSDSDSDDSSYDGDGNPAASTQAQRAEEARKQNLQNAKDQARSALTQVESPKRKTSAHHEAETFTGANAGLQVIIELYTFLQKENIDLNDKKEQERLRNVNEDVRVHGTLDLDDVMECCELLGHKLPQKKARALFVLIYSKEFDTGPGNTPMPEDTISLGHFIETLREKPPTLSLWHSRAIGGVALKEQRSQRLSEGLLGAVHESERHGDGSHVVMNRRNIALGHMATDPNTQKSREVHEFKESLRDGWNHDFSGENKAKAKKERKAKGFGNIFETLHTHHHGVEWNPKQRRSSISVSATHDLSTTIGTHTERTLLKIGLYCKRYEINVWEVLANYDHFGDGYIEEDDVKVALNDIGLNITIAESKLVYNAYMRPGNKEKHGRIKVQDLHDGICKYMLSNEKRLAALRSSTNWGSHRTDPNENTNLANTTTGRSPIKSTPSRGGQSGYTDFDGYPSDLSEV